MTKIKETRRKYTGARLDSKQVRDAVKAYLEEVNECTIQDLYEKFKSEKGHDIPRIGEQKAIIEWLKGLGCECEFYYNGIAELMAKWTGDSVESQEQYIDERGDDVYWILLGREILKGKKGVISESVQKVQESESDEYNLWLAELNDICEDVNADYEDKDALFFARAGYPKAFVKGKRLDQMVDNGEAEDLGTAFAMIADEYTNANFMYDYIDEKNHQIEISMLNNE